MHGFWFGADDAYTTYDKQLFKGGSSSMLFKPTSVDDDTYGGDAEKLVEKATAKFKANHEFEGAEDARRSRKVCVVFYVVVCVCVW